jgi:hypothetical protein
MNEEKKYGLSNKTYTLQYYQEVYYFKEVLKRELKIGDTVSTDELFDIIASESTSVELKSIAWLTVIDIFDGTELKSALVKVLTPTNSTAVYNALNYVKGDGRWEYTEWEQREERTKNILTRSSRLKDILPEL